MTKVTVADRPYLLTFTATGTTYPLTSEDARRLVAEYPITTMRANRLTLRADDGYATILVPATLGGGPAFVKVNES